MATLGSLGIVPGSEETSFFGFDLGSGGEARSISGGTLDGNDMGFVSFIHDFKDYRFGDMADLKATLFSDAAPGFSVPEITAADASGKEHAFPEYSLCVFEAVPKDGGPFSCVALVKSDGSAVSPPMERCARLGLGAVYQADSNIQTPHIPLFDKLDPDSRNAAPFAGEDKAVMDAQGKLNAGTGAAERTAGFLEKEAAGKAGAVEAGREAAFGRLGGIREALISVETAREYLGRKIDDASLGVERKLDELMEARSSGGDAAGKEREAVSAVSELGAAVRESEPELFGKAVEGLRSEYSELLRVSEKTDPDFTDLKGGTDEARLGDLLGKALEYESSLPRDHAGEGFLPDNLSPEEAGRLAGIVNGLMPEIASRVNAGLPEGSRPVHVGGREGSEVSAVYTHNGHQAESLETRGVLSDLSPSESDPALTYSGKEDLSLPERLRGSLDDEGKRAGYDPACNGAVNSAVYLTGKYDESTLRMELADILMGNAPEHITEADKDSAISEMFRHDAGGMSVSSLLEKHHAGDGAPVSAEGLAGDAFAWDVKAAAGDMLAGGSPERFGEAMDAVVGSGAVPYAAAEASVTAAIREAAGPGLDMERAGELIKMTADYAVDPGRGIERMEDRMQEAMEETMERAVPGEGSGEQDVPGADIAGIGLAEAEKEKKAASDEEGDASAAAVAIASETPVMTADDLKGEGADAPEEAAKDDEPRAEWDAQAGNASMDADLSDNSLSSLAEATVVVDAGQELSDSIIEYFKEAGTPGNTLSLEDDVTPTFDGFVAESGPEALQEAVAGAVAEGLEAGGTEAIGIAAEVLDFASSWGINEWEAAADAADSMDTSAPQWEGFSAVDIVDMLADGLEAGGSPYVFDVSIGFEDPVTYQVEAGGDTADYDMPPLDDMSMADLAADDALQMVDGALDISNAVNDIAAEEASSGGGAFDADTISNIDQYVLDALIDSAGPEAFEGGVSADSLMDFFSADSMSDLAAAADAGTEAAADQGTAYTDSSEALSGMADASAAQADVAADAANTGILEAAASDTPPDTGIDAVTGYDDAGASDARTDQGVDSGEQETQDDSYDPFDNDEWLYY